MKLRNKPYIPCFGAGVLCIIAFAVKLSYDHASYSQTLNSAPFYLWVLVDILYFLVPAVLLFGIGLVLRSSARARDK